MNAAIAAALVLGAVLVWPSRGRVGVDGMGVRSAVPRSTGGPSRPGVQSTHPWEGFRGRLGGRGRRTRSAELEAVLVILDSLAPALRAGLAPAGALRCLDVATGPPMAVAMLRAPGAAPVHPGLSAVDLVVDLLAAAEAGERLAPVWGRAARVSGSPELALISRAWALSEDLGAPLADSVALAADLVRQRTARERRLAVALAGPRASTTVLSLLPALGPGVALLLGISPAELYGSASAVSSVAVGGLFLMVGRWWCARMVGGLARPRPAGRGSG